MIGRPVIITSLEEDLSHVGRGSHYGEEFEPVSGEPDARRAGRIPGRSPEVVSDDPLGPPYSTNAPPGMEDEEDEPEGEVPGFGHMATTRPSRGTGNPGRNQQPEYAPGHEGARPPEMHLPMTGEHGEEEAELNGAHSAMEAIARITGKKSRLSERSTKRDRAASLLEDVRGIIDEVESADKNEASKSFANIAVIGDMLSRGFHAYSEEFEDKKLARAARAFAALSEDAEYVHGLLQSEQFEVNESDLEAQFESQMEALLNGLTLYSDIVEADLQAEEEEDDDDEDEEEDGDDEDDDDEDEEDDDEDEDDDDEDDDEDSESSGRKRRNEAGGNGLSLTSYPGDTRTLAQHSAERDQRAKELMAKRQKARSPEATRKDDEHYSKLRKNAASAVSLIPGDVKGYKSVTQADAGRTRKAMAVGNANLRAKKSQET
jgi:hypothetical protein